MTWMENHFQLQLFVRIRWSNTISPWDTFFQFLILWRLLDKLYRWTCYGSKFDRLFLIPFISIEIMQSINSPIIDPWNEFCTCTHKTFLICASDINTNNCRFKCAKQKHFGWITSETPNILWKVWGTANFACFNEYEINRKNEWLMYNFKPLKLIILIAHILYSQLYCNKCIQKNGSSITETSS